MFQIESTGNYISMELGLFFVFLFLQLHPMSAASEGVRSRYERHNSNTGYLTGQGRDLYLDETLADVAGAQGFVAAGGQRQPGEEEEESCGGWEDHLTRPHPDGSPARHWKHLHQHAGQDFREQINTASSLTFHKRGRGAAAGCAKDSTKESLTT